MTSRTPRHSSSKLNSNSFMSRDHSHSPANRNGSSSSDSVFIYDSRLKNIQLNSNIYMRDADNTGTFSHLFPLNSNYSNRNSSSNSPVIDKNGTNMRGTLFSVSESSQSDLPPLGTVTVPAVVGNNNHSSSSQGSLSSSTGKSRKTVSTSIILDETRTPESYMRQLHSGVAHSFHSAGVSTSSLSTSNYKSLPESQESIKRHSVITEGVPINHVITQAETLTRASSSTYYSLPVESPAGLTEDINVLTLGNTLASSHGQQRYYSGEVKKYTSQGGESMERLNKSSNLPVLNARRRLTEYDLPSSSNIGREVFSTISTSATRSTKAYSTVAAAGTVPTTIPQNRIPKRFIPPLSPQRLYSIPRRFESLQLRDSYGTVSLNKVPYNSNLVGLIPSHLDSSSSSDIFLGAIDLSRHTVKGSFGSDKLHFDIPEDSIPFNIEGSHAVTTEIRDNNDNSNIENVPLLISSPLSTLSTMDAHMGQHFRGHTTTTTNTAPINQYQQQPIGIRNLRGAQGTLGSIMGGTMFVTPQPNAVFPKRSTQTLRSHLYNQDYYDNDNAYNYDNDNESESESDKPSIEHIQRVSSESIRSFDSTTHKFQDIFSVFNVIKLLLLGLIAPPFFFMVVFNESCGIPEYTLMRMLMNRKHRALSLFEGKEFWDVDIRWFKKICLVCGLLELLLVFAAIGVGFGVGIGRSG